MDTFHRVSQTPHCVLFAITCLLSNINSIQLHRNDPVSNKIIPARFVREIPNDLQFQNDTYKPTPESNAADVPHSSKPQTFLVESFSNIATEIETEVMDLYLDSVNEVVREEFNKLLPSKLDQIKSTLNNLQTGVDNNVTYVVNQAIRGIVYNKWSLFDIINQAEVSSGQNIMNHELNVTISQIFKEIRQPWIELVTGKQEPGDSTLVTEELNHISAMINSTMNDLLPNMQEVSHEVINSSALPSNVSLDMLKIVDSYFYNKKLNNITSLSNNELISELLKFSIEYKNKMVNGIDFLLIPLLVKTENLTLPHNNLWNATLNILKHLQRNVIETKINHLKKAIVIQDPNQFEKSSMLKIEEILNRTLTNTDLLSSVLLSIDESLHDTLNITQVMFNRLKNESNNENSKFVKTAHNQIKGSLNELLFSNESLPLFKLQFQSKSSSFDTSSWNQVRENITKTITEYLSFLSSDYKSGHTSSDENAILQVRTSSQDTVNLPQVHNNSANEMVSISKSTPSNESVFIQYTHSTEPPNGFNLTSTINSLEINTTSLPTTSLQYNSLAEDPTTIDPLIDDPSTDVPLTKDPPTEIPPPETLDKKTTYAVNISTASSMGSNTTPLLTTSSPKYDSSTDNPSTDSPLSDLSTDNPSIDGLLTEDPPTEVPSPETIVTKTIYAVNISTADSMENNTAPLSTTSSPKYDLSIEHLETIGPSTDNPSTDSPLTDLLTEDPPMDNSTTDRLLTEDPSTEIPLPENIVTKTVHTVNISTANAIENNTAPLSTTSSPKYDSSTEDLVTIGTSTDNLSTDSPLTGDSSTEVPPSETPVTKKNHSVGISPTNLKENNTSPLPNTPTPQYDPSTEDPLALDSLMGNPSTEDSLIDFSPETLSTSTSHPTNIPISNLEESNTSVPTTPSSRDPLTVNLNDLLNIPTTMGVNSDTNPPIPSLDTKASQSTTESSESFSTIDENVSTIRITSKSNTAPLQSTFPSTSHNASKSINTMTNQTSPCLTNPPTSIPNIKSNGSTTENLEPAIQANNRSLDENTPVMDAVSKNNTTILPNTVPSESGNDFKTINTTTFFPHLENSSVESSTIPSNIMTIPPRTTNSKTNGSSALVENKDHQTSNKTTRMQCVSELKQSLIHSFSKIITDISQNIISLFIDALNKACKQVLDQIFPSVSDKISASLSSLQIFVDYDTARLVNDALQIIFEQKSSIFKVINHIELQFGQNITNSSQILVKYQLNSTILDIFKEIEQPLVELTPMRQDSHNSKLFFEELNYISFLLVSAALDLFHSINATANEKLSNSTQILSTSLEMQRLVNNYFDNQPSDYEQFSADNEYISELINNERILSENELFSDLINNLIELTIQYKNNFVKDMDYSFVDLILKANGEKELYKTLLKNIFNVVKDSESKLCNIKVNQLKNTTIIQQSNQFEKLSLLKIRKILNSTSGEQNVSNLVVPIEESLKYSMKIVQILFEQLKSMSDDGTVLNVYTQIENLLFDVLLGLQKEVPPLFEDQFYNASSSLNISRLNETYKNILENAFESLSLCENDELFVRNPDSKPENITVISHNSTSAGLFVHPFKYLLMLTLVMIGFM